MPSSLSPGRHAALVVGVPLILISFAWNGVSLASLAGHTTKTQTTVYDVAGSHLSVAASSGRVTVGPSPDGRVHVVTTLHYGLRVPGVTQRLDATGLHVATDCRWYDQNCSIDLDVTLPKEFSLDVDASGGQVTANGLSGPAHLSSSGGSVRVSDMSGPLELSSSGGSVRGSDLTSASVIADSSGGSVEIGFVAPPSHVDVDSSGGGVTVRLPAEFAYAIDASASGGSAAVARVLRNDSASPRTVKVRSSGGSATVGPSGG